MSEQEKEPKTPMRFDNKSSFFVFLIHFVSFFLSCLLAVFPLKNFIEFFFVPSIQGKS